MNFHFEMKVEVCCDEDGFEGAWFPATIIGYVANAQRPRFIIEYNNFVTSEWTGEHLIEELYSECIQPLPLVDSFESL